MLTCIALDDEPLALRIISTFTAKHPAIQLAGTFNNPHEAKLYLANNSVDLIFLDIDMLEINGIDFAKNLNPRPLLIFTTAHKEYAIDGFELDSVDYLLKPFDFTRFERAIDKAMTRSASQSHRPFLIVNVEYQRIKIYLDEIECLESMQDYIKIHLIQGKTILTLSTMKAMLDRLPPNQFIRIHRSFVIAVKHIITFSQRKIQLPNFTLKVGDGYYNEVIKCLRDSSMQ
ncbi:LytR/AlgR family response regulator transcription factor [Sphingobacterium multivorum]|uniref:LytR/AlgR family response regulator transcription factor n=1 Tax=Sphingobacterium multivorum TaxID=28454 RepID=UPI0028A9232C|nr:LytTR family DNA-binding domain-containing protein [Sphingobacterium multivorum]